jgi:DnaJ family protein C protein 28
MAQFGWETYIERQIREAMENGEFTNLHGEGHPLDLEENLFEDQEKWTAHHLLKSNGFTLPWISRRNEILAAIEQAKVPLHRTHALFLERKDFRESDRYAGAMWLRAQDNYRERVAQINKEIDDYNLMAPFAGVRMNLLNPDREIRRLAESQAS